MEATWPREGHITWSDLENRIKASEIARSNCYPDLSLGPSCRAWPGRWLNPVIWFSHNENSTHHTPADSQSSRTEVALFSYLLYYRGLFFAAIAGGNAFPNETGSTLSQCGCIVWKSHTLPQKPLQKIQHFIILQPSTKQVNTLNIFGEIDRYFGWNENHQVSLLC